MIEIGTEGISGLAELMWELFDDDDDDDESAAE